MKNYNRAYNRQMKHTKFIKRVKIWFANPGRDKEYWLNETLKGNHYTFLRTTSRPCNCYMCTYEKYKRTLKHKRVNLDD